MLVVVPFASFPAVAAKAQQGLRAWTGVGDHDVLDDPAGRKAVCRR